MKLGDAVPMDPDMNRKPAVPDLPPPLVSPAEIDPDMAFLLDALRLQPAFDAGPQLLRRKLFDRVARSAAAGRAMVTVRLADARVSRPAPGVEWRQLYAAQGAGLRRGEPRAAHWIELAPGATWSGGWPACTDRREWLVVRGSVIVGDVALDALDYHVVPAGAAIERIASDVGATLYLREAPAPDSERQSTTDYSAAAWADFAPGIKRRVLWTRGSEAAMLYHALPGAAVPRHGHGHDEECLMLDGELFLDEILLRTGEYQLAPAGSEHGGLMTDTGAVIYAHGDLDLAVIGA